MSQRSVESLSPHRGDLPWILTDDETFGRMFFSCRSIPSKTQLSLVVRTAVAARDNTNQNYRSQKCFFWGGGSPLPSCFVCVFGMPD